MNNPAIFLQLIIFLIIGCSSPKTDLRFEEISVRKADSTLAALSKKNIDVEKIIAYYSDDAIVVIPGMPVIKGKAALRKMIEDAKDSIIGYWMTWQSSDINFSPDGKLAYLYRKNFAIIGRNVKLSGIYIHGRGYSIWRKETDDTWKCVVDISNEEPYEG
jgi:ketosteroid isomerase-like protein